MPRALVLLMLLAAGGAALAHADAPRKPTPAAPSIVRPVPEAQAVRSSSGMTAKQRLVVRDDATWAKVWAELASNYHPRPTVPSIDFARDVVIVASMGGQSGGGHEISVADVRIAGGNARISIVERSPGRRCVTTAAMTAPVAVVVVPRFAGRATFVERATTADCK